MHPGHHGHSPSPMCSPYTCLYGPSSVHFFPMFSYVVRDPAHKRTLNRVDGLDAFVTAFRIHRHPVFSASNQRPTLLAPFSLSCLISYIAFLCEQVCRKGAMLPWHTLPSSFDHSDVRWKHSSPVTAWSCTSVGASSFIPLFAAASASSFPLWCSCFGSHESSAGPLRRDSQTKIACLVFSYHG